MSNPMELSRAALLRSEGDVAEAGRLKATTWTPVVSDTLPHTEDCQTNHFSFRFVISDHNPLPDIDTDRLPRFPDAYVEHVRLAVIRPVEWLSLVQNLYRFHIHSLHSGGRLVK